MKNEYVWIKNMTRELEELQKWTKTLEKKLRDNDRNDMLTEIWIVKAEELAEAAKKELLQKSKFIPTKLFLSISNLISHIEKAKEL